MSKAPLVSVVIPVYNAEHYLAECLDSLLGQTLRETEIIAVDDGSTDESPAILENFAARDPRLKVIRQANAGVSAARNRGMAEARGKYLTFVDADDQLDLQALGYLCFEAERLQTDILLFNYAAVRDGKYQRCTLLDELFNRFGTKAFDYREGEDLLYYVHGTAIGKFYRTELLRKNGLQYPDYTFIGEDFCFWVETALAAERFAVCNQIFYFYRKDSANSLTKRYDALARQMLQGYEGLRRKLKQKLPAETFRKVNFYIVDRNMISFIWNFRDMPDKKERVAFRRAAGDFFPYLGEYSAEEQQHFRHLKNFKRIFKPERKSLSFLGIRISWRPKNQKN